MIGENSKITLPRCMVYKARTYVHARTIVATYTYINIRKCICVCI